MSAHSADGQSLDTDGEESSSTGKREDGVSESLALKSLNLDLISVNDGLLFGSVSQQRFMILVKISSGHRTGFPSLFPFFKKAINSASQCISG